MRRLLLFAKRPLEGRVKTRLVPPLRPAQAVQLYRGFLDDQLRFLGAFAVSCKIELWLDESWTPAESLGAPRELEVRMQGPGDLGRRMLRAFRHAETKGASATVILGADAPTLPQAHVDRAFDALESGTPVVVGPARDGGYVLIGMRRPQPELFRGIPWGGPRVLAMTRERAAAARLRLHELPPWYDVDDGEGLRRLARELRSPAGRRRAPRTARVLGSLDYPADPVV